MARKRTGKPRSWFEPWTATKSTTHGQSPNVEGIPEDAAVSILDAWGRADRDADWILWGSGMCVPGLAVGLLSGTPIVCDDKRILAIRRVLGLPDGSPTNEETCKRIADCINAMEGIADPVAFITDTRAMLLSYLNGECVDDPRDDQRVLSLLARCIPLDEVKKDGYGEQPVD